MVCDLVFVGVGLPRDGFSPHVSDMMYERRASSSPGTSMSVLLSRRLRIILLDLFIPSVDR